MTSKLISIYRDAGAGELAWRAFSYAYKNYIRPRLPNKGPIFYADIAIGHHKFGDWILPSLYLPPGTEDLPDYEEALIKALRQHVVVGDNIVVVGGGVGVTCAIAAALTKTGHVQCFEGNYGAVKSVRRTAALNGLSDRISVSHSIVGENIAVYDGRIASNVIHPRDLPPCDILELDCEGAEITILRNMNIAPRVIAVETHAMFGAPAEIVAEILQARGYSVEDLGWAEPRIADQCAANGVKVLIGTLQQDHKPVTGPGTSMSQTAG